MSSAVSAIGVKTTCCISTMGVTAAGSPRMYVATGRPMLLAFMYMETSVPTVESARSSRNTKRASSMNAVPVITALPNATAIEDVNTSARFSFEISVNIRHGVATKKAKRCSTICAVGPPTFARAAR